MSVLGKIRSGWLAHPSNTVITNFVVQEHPVILRATPDAIATLEYLIAPQSGKQDTTPVWVDLTQGGTVVSVGTGNTCVVLTLPGVYRIKKGTASKFISFEEDTRTIEWDSVPVSSTVNVSGGSGSSHPAMSVTNAPAAFSFNALTQFLNVPQSPNVSIVGNNMVYQPGNGTPSVSYPIPITPTFVNTSDPQFINLSGDGSVSNPVTASINLSANPFNGYTADASGDIFIESTRLNQTATIIAGAPPTQITLSVPFSQNVTQHTLYINGIAYPHSDYSVVISAGLVTSFTWAGSFTLNELLDKATYDFVSMPL